MENSNLTIIAKILVKKEKVTLFLQEVPTVIESTRKEKGCITYDLHRDNDNSNQFLFYETWKNRALWQDHMNSPHITTFLKLTEDALEEVVLNEMTHIL